MIAALVASPAAAQIAPEWTGKHLGLKAETCSSIVVDGARLKDECSKTTFILEITGNTLDLDGDSCTINGATAPDTFKDDGALASVTQLDCRVEGDVVTIDKTSIRKSATNSGTSFNKDVDRVQVRLSPDRRCQWTIYESHHRLVSEYGKKKGNAGSSLVTDTRKALKRNSSCTPYNSHDEAFAAVSR